MTQRTSAVDLASRCYVHTAKEIGFGYESVTFSLRLFDGGQATITRVLRVRAYRKVHQLNHYLLVPKSRLPLDLDEKVAIAVNKSPLPSTEIRVIERPSLTEKSRVIILDIDPPLTKGDALDYSIGETLSPGSVALLANQLEADETENKFSFDISWPTRHLRIEVLLPLLYAPRYVDADVWRGPSRISVEEVARVQRNNLQRKHRFAKDNQHFYRLWLDVKFPPQGFVYALKWVPPSYADEMLHISDTLGLDPRSASTAPGASRSAHLRRQLAELKARYEILTVRIRDHDVDLGRESSFAERQIIQEKRDELFNERERVVSEMSRIEAQLAK